MSRQKDLNLKNIPPRDYQIELLDRAIKQNTIVSLGTGAGKTFIAILLIKEYSHRLFRNNENAVFIVNTVPLLDQQASQIEFHSSLNVARICGGGNNKKKYDSAEMDAIFSKHQVIVITAQIFLNLLNHGLIKFSSIALLIIDECHHALGGSHPYRLIMNHYKDISEPRPRVLGLTASILNRKVPLSRIESTIHKLEKIMFSYLETASEYSMVCKYVAKPKKLVIRTKDDETDEIVVMNSLERLKKFVEKNGDFLTENDVDPRKPILEAISRARSTLLQVGSWAAFKGCVLWEKRLHKLIDEPVLGPKQRCILRTAETTFKLCTKILSRKVNSINSIEKLMDPMNNFLSDRLRRMLEILKDYSPKRPGGQRDQLSGLIFVNERFIAYMINTLLKFVNKLCPEEFGFLKVDFLVGHTGTSETVDEDRRLANKKQEQTLYKFRNNQLNLLVATNVLEEGIDVRICNLVIRFDPPTDFRSYIQSSGRARKENSEYCMLIQEKDYEKFMDELSVYSDTEQLILKRYRDSSVDNIIAIEDEGGVPHSDEIIPPYVVQLANGATAKVALSGSIALINRYCSKLPSDIFTKLVPQYRTKTILLDDGETSMFKAELLLPINSPLKQIIRTHMVFPSKSMAMRAVALEACKLLHQCKELNDQLLPTGKEILTDLLCELDDEEYLPFLLNKIGSSKKKRLYDRKMARALTHTLPEQKGECYLYIIEMKMIRPVSEENNPKKRKIIDPYETNVAFGFLSSKELPNIPGFPVFQRHGEMLVQIKRARKNVQLTFELFQLICHFHQHLFEDILRIARGGVAFAPTCSPIPLLIVPLKKVGAIDFDYELDQTYLNWNIREVPMIPSDECRKNFEFDEHKYTDAVVNPWYRSEDQCAYYYVAEILKEHSPASPFPDQKFNSFNEYFRSKYQLEIYNQGQHLIDVDHTSAKMNLLLPRNSMGKAAKKPDPSQRQILVPELVHIHPLSAALWTMIVALPTVLYRINSLLLADEFRVKVIEDAFKGNPKTMDKFEWSVLSYATQNSDQTEQQIKNLDQLKKINQERKTTQSNVKAAKSHQNEEEMEMDTSLEEMNGEGREKNSFEIGVWDPSDALEYAPEPAPQQNVITPRNGFRLNLNAQREEEISELIAIGNDSTIQNYGDISDDDDIAEYDNFKFLMDNKMSATDLGDVECADVREAGWGDDEDFEEAKNNIQINNENLPLTISRNNPHINIESLMSDLERNYAGLGGGIGGGGGNPAANNIPATTNKKNVNMPSPRPNLSLKKLHLDPLQAMDEVDRNESQKKVEDVISEDLFWEDDEGMNGGGTNSPPEIAAGTKRSDSPEDLRDFAEIKKFELTVPELPWMTFSFMQNLHLQNPCGVSPALLLQGLTTSSAADGINLERLETIGDSFLKMAVTNYLYHTHTEQHEGKLSFARSKEVSNSRLFRLGYHRGIPLLMETLKFDPHVNWLPPCYASTSEFHAINPHDLNDLEEHPQNMEMQMDATEHMNEEIKEKKDAENDESTGWGSLDDDRQHYKIENGMETITFPQQNKSEIPDLPPMPYNMLTQQFISDKSIADAVEALIGAHLIQLGPEAALKFMGWLGIKVLTEAPVIQSPLLHYMDTEENPDCSLKWLMFIYNKFDFRTIEATIGYKFANKAYLIQAFTHASYYRNRVTGCYQRLEFLGDAILDYLITRFLFEHKKQYSPGVLTDLRSALVNNTIFASLAVKYSFHKHFMMLCPQLHQMIEKFVNFCKKKDFSHCANFDDEIFMITEEEIDEGHEEDVEVPKAMGDIFESVAGAVYLDCGMDLDIVWRVFYNLMREVIEKCCENPPQSPVRELFERKNCRAKFAKLERKLETGKVRVTVTVNDNLQFTGMGRSYRIAKSTAAKRALMHLRKLDAVKSAEKERKEREEAQKLAKA